jgi:hypothetical protein
MTGASRSKLPRFFRRGRPEDRVYQIEVPFTEDELALVEREAAAHGLSIDDYIIMRALERGEFKGNA